LSVDDMELSSISSMTSAGSSIGRHYPKL
jgi:hypothetical protein